MTTKQIVLAIFIAVTVMLALLVFVYGATEGISIDTKTHAVRPPSTSASAPADFDFTGRTVLGLATGGGGTPGGTNGQIQYNNAGVFGGLSAIPASQAGVPAAGGTLQVLSKNSATDYDTGWATVSASSEGTWSYTAGNNTMADPANGKFRTDQSTFSASANIAISTRTYDNIDRTNVLANLKINDTVELQDKVNAANYARYELSATPTNNSTWFQLPVTFIAGGGTAPAGNSQVIFTFSYGTGSVPPVTSVFTRTGAVTAQSGDYSAFYVPLTRTLTIAGTTSDLSANRTWTQDNITGLASTGIVKRTGANTLAIATAGTDYLTGNQTITLTGDVTGSGATSIATTNVQAKDGGAGFNFYNASDTTKRVQLSLASIPTATTRTLTIAPSANSVTMVPNTAPGTGATQQFLTSVNSDGTFNSAAVSGFEPALGNPGTNGFVLSSTTGGVRSWVANGAGGGTPGGANTYVQFNDSGAFGGDAGFSYDKVKQRIYGNSATGTSGQGFFLGSTSAPVGGLQALALTYNYLFFTNNKYYTGLGWADLGNSKNGAALQFSDDALNFYTFDTGTTQTLQWEASPGKFDFANNIVFGWAPNASWPLTPDIALARNSAGVVEVNNGTAGVYATLKAQNVNVTGHVQYNGANMPISFTNASTTSQTPATSDLYLLGSSIVVGANNWAAGGTYHCHFDIAKTGGTAAMVVTVRAGTSGTTADASIYQATCPAGTAVADTGTIELWVTLRTVGASATGYTKGVLIHNFTTTGLWNLGGQLLVLSPTAITTFNSTTATTIGVSVNGGAGFTGGTTQVVNADYRQ